MLIDFPLEFGNLYRNEFYGTEIYIMHFLEPPRFLNGPDLVGPKVNGLYDLGLAERPPHSSCLPGSYLWVLGP